MKEKSYSPSIQKAFSSPHYINLSFRFPGESLFVFLGRGGKNQGVYYSKNNFLPKNRIRDRFLEFIRKYIVGQKVTSIEVDKFEKLVTFTFDHRENKSWLSLFWKGVDLYFLFGTIEKNNQSDLKIYKSWEPVFKIVKTNNPAKEIDDSFNELGREFLIKGDEKKDAFCINEYLSKEVESSVDKKKIKFLKRKMENIEGDLLKIRRWKDISVELERMNPESSLKDVRENICGVKFKFDRGLNFYQKRDLVFKKIKNYKKGVLILEKRLSETSRQLENEKSNKKPKGSKIVTPVWKEKKNKATKKVSKNYTEFFILGKEKGAYGLSSIGNDEIRSSWASKNDFWFHLDGRESAHVILKISNISELTFEILDLMGTFLAAKSGHENIDQIPIMYTQVKNLKGIKGRAGAVNFKKEKRYIANRITDWEEKISIS